MNALSLATNSAFYILSAPSGKWLQLFTVEKLSLQKNDIQKTITLKKFRFYYKLQILNIFQIGMTF